MVLNSSFEKRIYGEKLQSLCILYFQTRYYILNDELLPGLTVWMRNWWFSRDIITMHMLVNESFSRCVWDFVSFPQVSVCSAHSASCLFHFQNREHVKFIFNHWSANLASYFVSNQAVNKVDKRNTISPICATTLGSVTQGGVSWTRSFSQTGKTMSSSNP